MRCRLRPHSVKPRDIFTNDIKLEIYFCANRKDAKVSMPVGIRNDGYAKSIWRRIHYSQANAVYGNRAFFDCHVSWNGVILKSKIPAAIGFFHTIADSGLVDVPLN